MKSSNKKGRKSNPGVMKADSVYPGSLQGPGRKEMELEFREIRKEITKKYTAKDKLIFQLLELKYQIVDYLNAENPAAHYNFGYFLKEYISRLNKNQAEFASNIGLDPSEISVVINNRRRPTEKLIFRLDIHSNKNFPVSVWIKIMEKDRLNDIARDSSVIDHEISFVKEPLAFYL